ncbi:MAG TPA: carboxypeptidase-like regulatory domain-containing protein, partial [Gemmatimonadales bacterium]
QVQVAVQPPASAQSGIPLAPQPEIQVTDQSGNPVSSAGISVVASLGSGTGTLGGTLTIPTNASGRAVFTNLAITGPSGSFTLRFTTAALGSVVTDPVTLGAGSATQLSIAIQPANTAQSGAALAPQPAIQLRDGANNPVALAGVTITAGIASGGGTLLGTTTAVTNGSGLATFVGLGISGTVGNRTLQFTAPGLTPVTSNTIAITPGAAAKLALTAQPSPTASSGTPFVQQPVVQIQDAAGNSVAESTTAITAAIETGAGGSLGGGLIALTNAAGQASYTNLALTGASGNYTLRFTSGTLTAVVSNTIALGAGAGSKLSLSQQPSPSAKNGQNFPQQPVAQLLDASDNPVAQAGVPIAVTILSGGGTLSGTRPIPTNGAGQAAFTDLAITGTVGDRTLIFAATGYSSITSDIISLTPGDPAALEITTQPSGSAQSGVPLAQQPVIHLEDVSGNAVSQAGIVVTATLASGTGTLANASATTDGSGVATFSSLTITGTVGSKTLGFSAASLTGTTSGIVNLASGAATQLTITTQPGGAASGQSLTPQPQVQLRDGAGNPVSQVGVIITAAIATAPGGSPTLTNPTATTDPNGLATFSGLTITGPVGSYTLQFSSGSLTPTTSGPVIVGAGTPSQLTITSAPSSNAQSGSALASQPLIQVRDAGGNAVGQAGLTVTAVIASGPGGSLGNASAITDGTGLATFTGLTITGPVGGYTLRFESGALTPATSGTITLAAGAPALITIEVQPPSNAQSGQAFTADPRVRVLDAGSNPLAAVSVTVALGTGAGNGTLNGPLAQSTDADGRVTFAGLSISGLIGNYTLGFAAGAASATSTGITLSAGTAAKLSIQTQPSPTARNDQEIAIQPVIQVEDAGGNPVTTSGLTVNAAIVSGGGTLSGTSATTNGSGQASFTGMKITGTIGTRTIQFSSGSLAVATSNGVTVTAGTATKILIVTNPPTSISSGSTLSPNPVVDLRDVSDNDVDSSGVEVTVGLASGAGTLSGTLVRTTGASGQAVFDDLVISGVPGDRTLGFSGSGLAGATSNTITVTAAAPAQLVITVSPSNTARSSIPLATAPEVQVLDGSSVPVSGVTVNASLDQAGSLSGSASGVSDIDGKVVFTGLTITGPVGNKTISFSANGLPTTTTSVIALSAGPATQLGIITQPGSPAINGELFSTQPVLQLLDGAGNSVDSSGASVDVAILAGTGVLAGVTTAVTGANGTAPFVDLAITGSTASPFTLQFTATGLTSATSNNIILQAGAATQLIIKTQPPASAVTAVTLSTPPEVELRDSGGNLVATNGVEVTAVLETISGAGVITPGSTNPVSTVGGVASFGNLSITGAGTFTLRFDAPGVSSATSIVITVTP